MAGVELAITVHQPWAQVIAEADVLFAAGIDAKLTENRSRPVAAKYLGKPIGIHAGLKWSEDGRKDARVREAWRAFRIAIARREQPGTLATAIAHGDERTGVVGELRPGLWMKQGVVIAVALLADCHQADQTGVGTCCRPWGDRYYRTAAGLVPAWHLGLADVQLLRRAVRARGQQTVPWRMPEDVAAAVNAQVVPAVTW